MYSRSDIWKLFHADQTTKTSLTDQSGHFSTRTVAHGVFFSFVAKRLYFQAHAPYQGVQRRMVSVVIS